MLLRFESISLQKMKGRKILGSQNEKCIESTIRKIFVAKRSAKRSKKILCTKSGRHEVVLRSQESRKEDYDKVFRIISSFDHLITLTEFTKLDISAIRSPDGS